MGKNDSKYFYTAELMNQALLALLEKKDIDFITVTEITKKAGVNRSTFYLHYDNVYELLEETIENLTRQFISSFDVQFPIEIKSQEDAFLITADFLAPYLNFCKNNKNVLKLVRKKAQLFNQEKAYRQMYSKILYPAISQFIEEETEKIYKLEFFTRGVVAIVDKWIELDCITEIDKLIAIIKNCVGFSF